MTDDGYRMALRRVLAEIEQREPSVVLIDGPSGAGKSTLADAVLASWPGSSRPTLVRMDDLYPGWGGLASAGRHVHDELLAPRSRGEAARWQRFDWAEEAPAEWVAVNDGHPLIVEGCGVLTRANAPLAALRMWLDADDALRKERALLRDRGAFDDHWDEWQQQFEAFLDTENPRALADLVLSVD